MKKLISILVLSVVFVSCKKDTPAPTPPAGPCHCGEILQINVTNGTLTAKNYCSGTILTFYVGGAWFSTGQTDYCQALAW